MAFRPAHGLVQRAIAWLTEFSQLTVEDLDLSARIQIAVVELTENVFKYCREATAEVEAALEQRSDGVYLRVQTTNRAQSEDIERVAKLVRESRASEDARAYYDALILSISPVCEPGVSGLGLARIRAEGELELDYRVEGDALTISFELAIGAPQGAVTC